MTVLAPEFLQTTKYSAQRMRQMMATHGLIQEGIVNFNDFRVVQRGAGANMSVDVGAGDAWVTGDNTARQGIYHVGNDATINVAIPAAHATLPRIDQVVLRIYDSTVIGGEKDLAVVEVVSGTATGGATLSNLTGAAALPASAIRLAYVQVAAADTSITNAEIGNLKDPRAGLTGYPAAVAPLAVTGAPPQYAHGRPLSYVPACRVYSSISITPGANVAIPFNTELFDTEEMHDLAVNTGRLVAKTPGIYLAHLTVAIEGVNATAFIAKGAAENSQSEGSTFINSSGSSDTIATTVRLGYGEFLVGYSNSAAQVLITGRTPTFGMTWQGP